MNKEISGRELIDYVGKKLNEADIRLHDSAFVTYISKMTPADFLKAKEYFK